MHNSVCSYDTWIFNTSHLHLAYLSVSCRVGILVVPSVILAAVLRRFASRSGRSALRAGGHQT